MINSLFDTFEIKTNPWIPKDKIVLMDRHQNVVRVIDTTDYRGKFFKLLNLGSINE